jgi:hypothetical protein
LSAKDSYHWQRHIQTENERMENKISRKWKQANKKTQAGVVMFLLDKVDFKPKLFRRDKEGHYILIKVTIHQEHIMITNL